MYVCICKLENENLVIWPSETVTLSQAYAS